MGGGKVRTIGWIVVGWWTAHVVLVLLSVIEVAAYASLVAPGLPHSAYEAHASVSAPWVSIVFGGPVFYALTRLLRGRLGGAAHPGGIAFVLYALTDFAIVTASGAWTGRIVVLWIVSQSLKAIGVALARRDRPGDLGIGDQRPAEASSDPGA